MPVSVIIQPRLRILFLRAEADPEVQGAAGGSNGPPEGVIFEMRRHRSVGAEVFAHVAVAVNGVGPLILAFLPISSAF